MRVLNDYKGNINGDVKLNYRDCELISSALFYLLHQETVEEKKQEIKALQGTFKFIMNRLND
jgi:hypothetical protein